MQITTWNPFREMDDFFSQFRRNTARPAAEKALANWEPAVDISEAADEYRIEAELPGVQKDDVKLSIDNGTLILSGERKFEQTDKDARQHRVERYYGSYCRSFSLPDDVLPEKISAEFKDGVLSVHLPRSATKRNKAIDIKVS